MGSSKLRLRPEVVDWAVVQARSQILGSGFVTRLGRNLSIPIAPEWSAILPLFGLWKSRPYIQAVHNRPGHGRTVSVHGVRSAFLSARDLYFLSAIVSGVSLESTTKTANRLAGSLSLAFSLIL
jgi:hypothetical protein